MDETQPPDSPDPRPAPPESIHAFADAELALRPLPPWAWLGASFRGGFRASGLHLLAAWAFFEVCTSAAWAVHLRGFTSFAGGWSALPQHWGEMLSAKDLWNLAVNGEMGREPFGTAVPCLAAFGLAWMFWASWRHQAEEAALPARLRDWILGLFDALVIGLVPLLLPFLLVSKLLSPSASPGTGRQKSDPRAGPPRPDGARSTAPDGTRGAGSCPSGGGDRPRGRSRRNPPRRRPD